MMSVKETNQTQPPQWCLSEGKDECGLEKIQAVAANRKI